MEGHRFPTSTSLGEKILVKEFKYLPNKKFGVASLEFQYNFRKTTLLLKEGTTKPVIGHHFKKIGMEGGGHDNRLRVLK